MTKNGDKKRHLLAAQKSFAAANLHVCRRRMIGLIICYPTTLEHPPCQDRICHVLELQRLRGKPNLKHYFCISDGNRQISQISDICFAWLGVIGNIGYLRSFRPRLVNTGQGLGIFVYLHIHILTNAMLLQVTIPHICHIFYTHTFLGQKILH